MEPMPRATGPSKLEQLLTTGRCFRRDSTEAAAGSGGSPAGRSSFEISLAGNEGNGTIASDHDQSVDKSRSPRKRTTLNSTPEPNQNDASHKSEETVNEMKVQAVNGQESSSSRTSSKANQNEIRLAEADGFIRPEAKDDTKPKYDYEYMGAQIDKLLSMSPLPSPPKKTKHQAKRQRRHQCKECPKSYSTEEDLKSHERSHSKESDKKMYPCTVCDKKFTWMASWKVHMKKFHNSETTSEEADADEVDSAGEAASSPRNDSSPLAENVPVATRKSTTADRPLPIESTFSMISSDIIQKNGKREKPTTPRTSSSRRAAQSDQSNNSGTPPSPHKLRQGKALTPKIGVMNKKGSNSKVAVADVKQIASTPSPGRTSLRRNIQRPKWLTDADLVTDYEFPRGTNAMRSGASVAIPPTTPAPTAVPATATNRNVNQTRSTTSEPAKPQEATISKSQKQSIDKTKSQVPTSRESRRKEEVQKSAKNMESSHKQSGEKKAAKVKNKKKPQVPSSKNREKTTKDVVDSESPTKQLSTKILTLSLSESSGTKSAKSPTPPSKTSGKRKGDDMSNDSSLSKESQPKRRRSLDFVDDKNSITDKKLFRPHESGIFTIPIVEERVQQKADDPAVTKNVGLGHTNSSVQDQSSATLTLHAIQPTTSVGSDSIKDASIAIQNTLKAAASKDMPEPFSNQNEGCITFADLVNGERPNAKDNENSSDPAIPDHNEESEQKLAEDDATVPMGESEIDTLDEHSAEYTIPLNLPKDEEMPILKPQTSSSSSIDCSVSNSGTERMNGIDEEISSSNINETHSNLPPAPALAKEGSTVENNVIPHETNTSAPDESDVAATLEELPFIDEDGDDDNRIIRTRRDRSDSLSMRSCGSGSQSEKIKGLEETTAISSKNDAASDNGNDNECLISDSDSNDSLMSEFSELAAQISDKTDGAKFKEDCLRFITEKISANSMWQIRTELKRLKKKKNYFRFGKLSPLAAGLMHDLFCQSLGPDDD